MINVEEHKKLLAQIAELEKNSVNYFDVEKEFFLIDSDNLAEVKTKFYGYSIQATGIYEQDNLTEDAAKNLDGRGCYVYVEARNGHITIKQDLNGCWGIYLFRHGDYFALSNSFFRLLDHVKFKYPLTVNRDYCHHLLANELVSHAYSETAVNEIQLVDRSAILHIHKTKKQLELELINYKENTVSLDSQEGITILDRWVEFWRKVFRNVAQRTNFIRMDLSGGFDSRTTLLVALSSGIDLNKIWINTSTSKNNKTYVEDYEIASQIANHYGFNLNKYFPERSYLYYSLTDNFKVNLYCLQPFYKDPLLRFSSRSKAVDKEYQFTGQGGETIRGYWRSLSKEFINKQIQSATEPYSSNLCRDLAHSLKTIFESASRTIRKKYGIEDENSSYIPQYLYQETRCRFNYGKPILSEYFRNSITLSPALDPEMRTLNLDTPECPDSYLLLALLFTRYEPDLLKFPIQGNRAFAPETIAYAQKINKRFPHSLATNNTNWGGDYSTYNRVTCKPRTFSFRARIIPICRAA